MLLQETLTEADREEKKKHKRPISDVAVVFGEVILEEVFDVKLFFENWKFFPDNEKKEKKEDKQLTFVVPKNFQANPSKNQKCQVVSTNWRRDGSSLNPYFWKATTQIAKVRGTRRSDHVTSQIWDVCFIGKSWKKLADVIIIGEGTLVLIKISSWNPRSWYTEGNHV